MAQLRQQVWDQEKRGAFPSKQIFDHKYVQRHEKAVAAKLADVSPGDSAFLVLSKIRDFWTKEEVPLKVPIACFLTYNFSHTVLRNPHLFLDRSSDMVTLFAPPPFSPSLRPRGTT